MLKQAQKPPKRAALALETPSVHVSFEYGKAISR
jgi:hypothetical protein